MLKPDFGDLGKKFNKLIVYMADFFYRLDVNGKQNLRNLEKKLDGGKIIVATTHANVLRSIAIGVALNRKFSFVVHEKWRKKFRPFVELLGGIWIPGIGKYCRNSLDQITDRLIEEGSPKYLLIAPSGHFDKDNPKEYYSKRGWAWAAIRAVSKNPEKRIYAVPTLEYVRDSKLLGKIGRKYHIIFIKPILINNFWDYNGADYLKALKEGSIVLNNFHQERIREEMQKVFT